MKYNCKTCEYATNWKSNYTRHCKTQRHLKKAVAGVKQSNYICELCNYSSNRKNNYERHCKSKKYIKKNSKVIIVTKPFECLACNKTFRSRVNCLPHLRNSEHQKNVRSKYPETLINPDSVRRIDVRQCHVYLEDMENRLLKFH